MLHRREACFCFTVLYSVVEENYLWAVGFSSHNPYTVYYSRYALVMPKVLQVECVLIFSLSQILYPWESFHVLGCVCVEISVKEKA